MSSLFLSFFSRTSTKSISAPGNRRGRNSTTSTLVPKEEYAVAISSPIYPPPTTNIFLGILSKDNAEVEFRMFL